MKIFAWIMIDFDIWNQNPHVMLWLLGIVHAMWFRCSADKILGATTRAMIQ